MSVTLGALLAWHTHMDANRNEGSTSENESGDQVYEVKYQVPAEIQVGIKPETLLFAAANNIMLPPITIQNLNVEFASPTIEFRNDLSKLEKLVQELQESVLTKELIPEVTRHIGNELVGESFLRWDSRVQYYPTLTLIFLEDEMGFQSRQSQDRLAVQRKVQIKVRVTDFEEIEGGEESLIEEYTRRCLRIEDLCFESGNLRCCYVNEGRCKWKTTVFVEHEEEAHAVLNRVCGIINTSYNRQNLTLTMGKRSNLFLTPCTVSLHKVALFLNKKEKAYILYHRGQNDG